MRRIYCYGSLDGLCESAAGQRRMLGGGAPADRLLSLNLSEWVTLFRVGVAHETSPWTESDIRFAANCWATGVIVSNEEKFGNPYVPTVEHWHGFGFEFGTRARHDERQCLGEFSNFKCPVACAVYATMSYARGHLN